MACIDLHQTGSVGKGSDYLQLIKFCPAPREGGLRRGKISWLRLTTASAQCLRLSLIAFFINGIFIGFFSGSAACGGGDLRTRSASNFAHLTLWLKLLL